jgi:septation ring formation regulator EzrA
MDERVRDMQRTVTAEVTAQIASLREMVQNASAKVTQLDRDLETLRHALDELTLVVYGNQRMNLIGVPQQIQGLRTAVTAEIAGVESRVAAVDVKVAAVDVKVASLDRTITDKMRNASWAFLLLAALMLWQPLLGLAKLLGIMP